MRDEEVQKIRSDMSSKRNISPIKNSKFNRRKTNDDIMNNFVDLNDRSSPPMERLSNEETNWQNEAEQFSPPERRFFPRNNGKSFNMAEVTAIVESGGDSSDPLPLGYWNLRSFYCIFSPNLFKTFYTSTIVDCTCSIAHV